MIHKEYLAPEDCRQYFVRRLQTLRPQDQIFVATWDDENLMNRIIEESVDVVIILECTSDMTRMVKNFLIAQPMEHPNSEQEVINIGWAIKEFAKKIKEETGCLVYVGSLPYYIGSLSRGQLSQRIDHYLMCHQEEFGEMISVIGIDMAELVYDSFTPPTSIGTRRWLRRVIRGPVGGELIDLMEFNLTCIEDFGLPRRLANLAL